MNMIAMLALLGWMLAQEIVHAEPSAVDVLVGEASSEGREGMEAVACVMKQRRWNLDGFSAAHRQDLEGFVSRQPTRVRALAQEVVAGIHVRRVDCDLSDHYLTVELYRSARCPTWARKLRVMKIVGWHVFLRTP